MIMSSNFNTSLQVGPREGGVPKTRKSKPTKTPEKCEQVAAPDFSAEKGAWGQLVLLKLVKKMGHKMSPKSFKKRYHRQRLFTNLFQERSGTDFKIDTRH